MAIRPKFTRADVQKRLDAFLAMVKKKQIDRMQRLGEMCLIEARLNGSYMDRTGNLRSSVGYCVFVDGVAVLTKGFDTVTVEAKTIYETRKRKRKDGSVVSYMAKVKIGGSGVNGTKAGQALAEKVGKNTKGVALVVVAGMNYAAYVEAKGYNVLSSAEHLAQRELPRMLEKLISNIKAVAE